jgi:hypothetical protein
LLAAVPAYQEGGIAKKPQMAMLAEKGPEMVMPADVSKALQMLPGAMGELPDISKTGMHLPKAVGEVVEELLKHGGAEKGIGLGLRGLAMAGVDIAGADLMGAVFPLLMHPTTLGASTLTRAQQLEAFQTSIAGLSAKTDPESKRLLQQLQTDPEYLRAKQGDDYTLHHAPTIHIHGNADEDQRKALQIQLDDASRKFIKQFRDAQRQERRLSYESGYS